MLIGNPIETGTTPRRTAKRAIVFGKQFPGPSRKPEIMPNYRYSVPAAVRVSKALLSSTRRIIWKGTASLKLLEMARLEKTDDAISEGTNVLCEAGEFCPTILPLTREDSVVGRMSGIPCLCAGMLDKILRDHTLRKRRRRDNN